MNQVSTVGLDLAKHIFQLHGADSAGAVVFRKKLRRGQVLSFLAMLPPCTVAMEACGSAHYWGHEMTLVHGYANPLKMLMLAKLMESPKILKLLPYDHIHATRSLSGH